MRNYSSTDGTVRNENLIIKSLLTEQLGKINKFLDNINSLQQSILLTKKKTEDEKQRLSDEIPELLLKKKNLDFQKNELERINTEVILIRHFLFFIRPVS